jgi:hypothetical protein
MSFAALVLVSSTFGMTDQEIADVITSSYRVASMESFSIKRYFQSHTGCRESVEELTQGVDFTELSMGLDGKTLSRVALKNMVRMRDNVRGTFRMNETHKDALRSCVMMRGHCNTLLDVLCKHQDTRTLTSVLASSAKGKATLSFMDTLAFASWSLVSTPPSTSSKSRKLQMEGVASELVKNYLPVVKQQLDILRESFPKSASPGVTKTITALASNATGLLEVSWKKKEMAEKVHFVQKVQSHMSSPANVIVDFLSFIAEDEQTQPFSSQERDSLSKFALTGEMNSVSRAHIEGMGIFVNSVDDPFWYPGVLPIMRAIARSQIDLHETKATL